ncbi:MAG: 50S ribosomal protein L23 [Parcubacteria group bacterium GW2011_GWB1_55_9]|nr:MAG: 50S ribosomal protein L23 [Parcubacteria group bacterium GW2011_GWB1_55_9]
MAIFGTKKKENKKAPASPRLRRARQAKLAAGVAHEIIRAPWFSEKALIATEKGVYTFAVPTRATKADIAGAIKEIYKVEPRKIRIVNLPGKHKALRTRRGEGVRAARRKAYVYLNKGDSIQFA